MRVLSCAIMVRACDGVCSLGTCDGVRCGVRVGVEADNVCAGLLSGVRSRCDVGVVESGRVRDGDAYDAYARAGDAWFDDARVGVVC